MRTNQLTSLACLAFLNAALRESALVPRLRNYRAHQLSSVNSH